MGGATWYNNRRGESVYPIRPGYVLFCKGTPKVMSASIGAYVAHHRFVWILGVSPKSKGQRAQDRIVHVFFCDVPCLVGMERHVHTRDRKFRVRSLTKYLKRGYDIVSDDVKWHRTRRSAKRFYRVVETYLGIKLL